MEALLPPATKLGQGNIFRSVCQEFCPPGGACMAGGPCVAGVHVAGVHVARVHVAGGCVGEGCSTRI